MRKRALVLFVIILAIGSLFAWWILGAATAFDTDKEFLFVHEGRSPKEQVLEQIREKDLLRSPKLFSFLAERAGVWDKLKPGRFEIKQGDNLITVVRMLRNNTQSAVKLTINKLRTRNDMAKLIQKQFDIDSAKVLAFISDNDSIGRWNVDTASFFTLFVPDTYEMYWTSSITKIIERLKKDSDKFWTDQRMQALQRQQLTKKEAYTIASIVEEETNANAEKGNIASVYMNRLKIGMPLGADPTIKYALRDFGLKRILYVHLEVQSPYNTYRNKGLPPGPICTPSKKSIDAVLNAPDTDYLYFVASDKFDGTHRFSTDYAQHQQLAKQYQQALDKYLQQKEGK